MAWAITSPAVILAERLVSFRRASPTRIESSCTAARKRSAIPARSRCDGVEEHHRSANSTGSSSATIKKRKRPATTPVYRPLLATEIGRSTPTADDRGEFARWSGSTSGKDNAMAMMAVWLKARFRSEGADYDRPLGNVHLGAPSVGRLAACRNWRACPE